MDDPSTAAARIDDSNGGLGRFGLDAPNDSWIDLIRKAEKPLPSAFIGSYELLEEVRRGGQGIVYRARKRGSAQVFALKRLLAGAFATSAARRRFEREIEALQTLDHPHIVTVRDVVVADATLVLAMEWIDGVPISRCSMKNGGSRRRQHEIVEVMAKVCDAVHHAHQRGVIHRDLKPSNILVDADDQPHVLDFGLAKTIAPGGTSDGSATAADQFVGTLSYAAPEQLRGGSDATDVRSDVYSLGVILYEMITGRLPHEAGDGLAAVAHAIENSDPVRPSTVVRQLDRDLEAITLKALAKDKSERYQSADALAGDLRAYRSGEPVLARNPGGIAQLRKALRRHQLAVTCGALVLVLVMGFAVATTILAFRSAEQRDLAVAAVEREAQARALAEREAGKAEAIRAFLVDMLTAADPTRSEKPDISVRTLLDQAAERIDSGFADQPELNAELRTTIGGIYRRLGLYDASERHLRTALDTRRRLFDGDHESVATSLHDLGVLLVEQGVYGEAETSLTEALRMRRALLGDEHLRVAQSMSSLATLKVRSRFDLAGAEPLLRRTLAMQRKLLGNEHVEVAGTLNNLAIVLKERCDPAAAQTHFREALEMSRKLYGDTHPRVAAILVNLGECARASQDLSEAERLFREALTLYRDRFGPEHPLVAHCLDALGGTLVDQLRYAEAESCFRAALAIQQKRRGERHFRTLGAMFGLAQALHNQTKLSEAGQLFRRVVELARDSLPPGHLATATFQCGYGGYLTERRRFESAEPHLLESYRVFRAVLGDDHASTKLARQRLLDLYDAWDKPDRAAEFRE